MRHLAAVELEISHPAICGRPSRLTAGSRSSVLITALPFASCPVTMRRTSIAIFPSSADVLRAPGYSPGDRPCYWSAMTSAEPIDNRLFVLILQHPQEKREALATAGVTRALLNRAELAVGLSWPNLARALGHPADATRWAVLYLGSAKPAAFKDQVEVVA